MKIFVQRNNTNDSAAALPSMCDLKQHRQPSTCFIIIINDIRSAADEDSTVEGAARNIFSTELFLIDLIKCLLLVRSRLSRSKGGRTSGMVNSYQEIIFPLLILFVS